MRISEVPPAPGGVKQFEIYSNGTDLNTMIEALRLAARAYDGLRGTRFKDLYRRLMEAMEPHDQA